MKIYYLDLLNILHVAERRMLKDKETAEYFEDELKMISEIRSFLYKDKNEFFEIKGSNPF